MIVVLMWIAAGLCAGSLAMTIANLRLYRPPVAMARSRGSGDRDGVPAGDSIGDWGGDPGGDPGGEGEPIVSVCIPARNEATNIEACVCSAMAGNALPMEVLVHDDQSDDATPEILARLVAEEARVRSVERRPLPEGFNGKQFGCDRLGRAARGRWLLFTDADVRFAPGAVDAAVAEAESMDVALLSTFPRQITGSFGERMLVPMIHFVLFSYLPMIRMRRTPDPAASAGCGQFLLCRRDAWESVGGHASWKASMHDGIMMPRAFREAGHRTDLFDGTELVTCRMYDSTPSAWRGFAKNAFEGLGSIGLLLFLTVVHAIGHLLPWIVLILAFVDRDSQRVSWHAATLAGIAIGLASTQRMILAIRFRQSIVGVLLHPVAVMMMTAVQWHSWWLHLRGRRAWRGRTAGTSAA